MEDDDDSKTNVLDTHYHSLDCGLDYVEKDHDEFKMVKNLMTSVSGSYKKYFLNWFLPV